MAAANMPQSGWYTLCQCPRCLQLQAPSDSSDGAVVAIASISLDASLASSPLPSSKACLPQLCPKPPQLRSAPAAALPSSIALSGLCISKPCPFSFLGFLVRLQSVVHLGARLVSSLLCLVSVLSCHNTPSMPGAVPLHFLFSFPLFPCPFLSTPSAGASMALPSPIPAFPAPCLFCPAETWTWGHDTESDVSQCLISFPGGAPLSLEASCLS